MSMVEKIQQLCINQGTTLIGLERKIGIGRGTIRKWDKSYPSIDKVKKVADYFNITTDYLISEDEAYEIAKQSFTEETKDMQEAFTKLSPKMRKKILAMIEAFTEED